MTHNWIIDVLADLKQFAQQNDLVALAEQLDDTTLVAATEISSKNLGAPTAVTGDGGRTGDSSRTVTSSGNA